MSEFSLRYAPHLGFRFPTPMFVHSVSGDGMLEQVRFAKEQGFAGLFHPWIGDESAEDIAEFKSALDQYSLQSGSIVYTTREDHLRPVIASGRNEDRDLFLRDIYSKCELANQLGAQSVAVLVMSDVHGETLSAQMKNAAANLRLAGDIADEHEVVLGLEPMRVIPNMLLDSVYKAADLIDLVDRRAVRLIFDTGHVHEMDGDIVKAHSDVEKIVSSYQLRDMPGAVEPGSGELDFIPLLTGLIKRNYQGLIELEHHWSREDPDVETEGIALLRQIDAESKKMADSD